MTEQLDYLTKRVVYSIPGMDAVPVTKDITYKTAPYGPLALDLYHPIGQPVDQPAPALAFIHGEAPPAELKTAKDWGQYVSWGQLAAASGMVGVTFNHRPSHWFQHMPDVAEDVADLLDYLQSHATELRIDQQRIGIWVCSGGTPPALQLLLSELPAYVRCLTVCYGCMSMEMVRDRLQPSLPDDILHKFSPVHYLEQLEPTQLMPLLLVRCGADQAGGVNGSNDEAVNVLLKRNLPFTFINYPTGQHTFDVEDDQEESRRVIWQIIAFAREYLIVQ